MLTSWPAAANARGRAPTTSAKPPVFEKGTHSEATNAICMSQKLQQVLAVLARYDIGEAPAAFLGSACVNKFNWRDERGSMKASSARVPQKKPKLGQHFLTDTVATIRIVEALGDLSRATVFEIGPGRGALTSLLARRARRVIAVEADRVLAAQLRMRFSLAPNVEVIEGDILAVDFNTLFGPKPGSTRPGMEQAPEKVRVIGNLPYFITSDILLRLFEHRN